MEICTSGVSEPQGWKLPFPVALAIGFYNSLYHRTSRDKPNKLKGI